MIDSSTNEKLVVSGDGNDGPYIMVPIRQMGAVCAVLDDSQISYWVDEFAISLDGEPEISVINLGKGIDKQEVQRILDCAA
ncbi:hypothetical protein Mal52_50140 [Symmachiella dynata]|uniref:Uncharacterized protein n=1 Tax=Symmachiella dynata TaxID=2527995 RepID=A0A517ZVH8_9PLAN|nr:hypothetical protein [Symmachiella dynata]QDU46493.1 hypothetical protein Mal52_50140 [Symmachiella dynata]